MPKINRNGQAKVLSNSDYQKLNKVLLSDSHRVFLAIARWTGERWGAICQLKVDDCYHHGVPRASITFRAATRKARPDGERRTRECPAHPSLLEALKAYRPGPQSVWLFPNRLDPFKHLTYDGADKWFRAALVRAGLDGQGYSTHSTRRTFITRLAQNGIDIKTLSKLTGHQDARSLMRYIDVPEDRLRNAIATL